MDKHKALNKIKKCLALTKSTNEFEAAQALKQAQALMRDFEVSEQDLQTAHITQTSHAYTSRAALWQVVLVNVCAQAFACSHVRVRQWQPQKQRYVTEIQFVGVGARSELAAYAYSVLLRQIRAARRLYRQTVLKRLKNAQNIAYRLDAFSMGWVGGVKAVTAVFANKTTEQAYLNDYMHQHYPQLRQCEVKSKPVPAQLGIAVHGDYVQGERQGQHAQLNHAMRYEAWCLQIVDGETH